MHGKSSNRAEQEADAPELKEEQRRRAREQETNRQNNRRMLDTVLENLPTALTREDHEMLVFAAIDRFEYEDWEAITDRYPIDADQSHEPDAVAIELRKMAAGLTDAQLVRMLVELALLRSGYSDETLEANDLLASAARRY